MLTIFQRALLGLLWICFVSGYYSSAVPAPKLNDINNGEKIIKTDLPLMNIGTVSDEPLQNEDESHKCDDPETCKNGGKCVEAGKDFTCDCLKEFTGKDCSGTVWCEKYGGLVCGKVPCKYNPALNRSFCDCGEAQYFDVKVRKCKKIYECLELQLDGKCLSPHEMCQKGTCSCEKGYEYTKNNETCVRKNMCPDDNKKKSCTEIAALCIEDLDADNEFKCICEDGYARDISKNGTCTHKCKFESNIEKCSRVLSFCELDSDYNSKCTCPPIYLEESTKSCNKLAEYFFIDAFQILKKPYEVFRDPETITSFVDYTKLGKDFKEAFSSVFKFYKSSKVFNCKEKSEYLNCTVELQLTKLPGEELNLIFTPSVCLPITNSKYCLIPPRLILRNKQHDTESSSQKLSFIIGGTLGTGLFVSVLISIILIWKYRKQALKIEEEEKTYELRRRQWIGSKRERQETRNERKTENLETDPKIYTEQENSIQRQYRQRYSGQYVNTNVQVYHPDYIQRAHAKANMGISYQRSHSNNEILYTNAVVHRESEESINDAENDENQETYVKRRYHDPKKTHDTSLDLQISSNSNDDFYYTTIPSGVDATHVSELEKRNTEVENKVWKKHNDAKYYKKYKSRQMFKSSDAFQDNLKSSKVPHESYKDVATSKQNKFSLSNDESYDDAMLTPNINNKDYELRSGKDTKKMNSNQQEANENVGMQYNGSYKEDEIML